MCFMCSSHLWGERALLHGPAAHLLLARREELSDPHKHKHTHTQTEERVRGDGNGSSLQHHRVFSLIYTSKPFPSLFAWVKTYARRFPPYLWDSRR